MSASPVDPVYTEVATQDQAGTNPGNANNVAPVEQQGPASNSNKSSNAPANGSNNFVCCCIDPYLREEGTAYIPMPNTREGDVFKHRVHFRTRVICFNLCHSTENTTQTIIQRASDGAVLKTVTVEELNQPNNYFLVRSEKCNHKHHDMIRMSIMGRILFSLCTPQGLLSTCRKCVCIEDCTSTSNIDTIRCERSLYSRRRA